MFLCRIFRVVNLIRCNSLKAQNPDYPQIPDSAASTGTEQTVLQMASDAGGSAVACRVKNGPVMMLNTQLALSAFTTEDQNEVWQEVLPASHAGEEGRNDL